MNKPFVIFAIIGLMIASAYAQNAGSDKSWSSPVQWKSNPETVTREDDVITIQSATPNPYDQVHISLDHKSGGAKITHCGEITRLSAGSSAICPINMYNAVTITSDELGKPAYGSYQISQ